MVGMTPQIDDETCVAGQACPIGGWFDIQLTQEGQGHIGQMWVGVQQAGVPFQFTCPITNNGGADNLVGGIYPANNPTWGTGELFDSKWGPVFFNAGETKYFTVNAIAYQHASWYVVVFHEEE